MPSCYLKCVLICLHYETYYGRQAMLVFPVLLYSQTHNIWQSHYTNMHYLHASHLVHASLLRWKSG